MDSGPQESSGSVDEAGGVRHHPPQALRPLVTTGSGTGDEDGGVFAVISPLASPRTDAWRRSGMHGGRSALSFSPNLLTSVGARPIEPPQLQRDFALHCPDVDGSFSSSGGSGGDLSQDLEPSVGPPSPSKGGGGVVIPPSAESGKDFLTKRLSMPSKSPTGTPQFGLTPRASPTSPRRTLGPDGFLVVPRTSPTSSAAPSLAPPPPPPSEVPAVVRDSAGAAEASRSKGSGSQATAQAPPRLPGQRHPGEGAGHPYPSPRPCLTLGTGLQ